MPVRPPNRKVARKPTANSIGVSKVSLPFHMVPIQFTNFTPVGTAIRNVLSEKNDSRTAPVANMWWAHGHPGAAQADDRGDEVDRAQDRAEPGHDQPGRNSQK